MVKSDIERCQDSDTSLDIRRATYSDIHIFPYRKSIEYQYVARNRKLKCEFHMNQTIIGTVALKHNTHDIRLMSGHCIDKLACVHARLYC